MNTRISNQIIRGLITVLTVLAFVVLGTILTPFTAWLFEGFLDYFMGINPYEPEPVWVQKTYEMIIYITIIGPSAGGAYFAHKIQNRLKSRAERNQ